MNPRPHRPERCALPSCATPRNRGNYNRVGRLFADYAPGWYKPGVPLMKFLASVKDSIIAATKVVTDTWVVLRRHPEITIYPYAAGAFISISFPLVSATIFADWYHRAFSQTDAIVPQRAHAILGLVGFWAFYSALVTAYFTCAVSINVIAKLEERRVPPFYGLLRVARHFIRVTKFAVLSVFFFPVGIYAQRRKLPGGWLGVLGSSISLHMAQVAPAILSTQKKFGATVRDAIDTLGAKWREGLVLKIGMYSVVFLIIALPKLIQHGLFKGQTASNIGWIISIELGASSLVGFKVLNSIFTAVMYHQAKQKENT